MAITAGTFEHVPLQVTSVLTSEFYRRDARSARCRHGCRADLPSSTPQSSVKSQMPPKRKSAKTTKFYELYLDWGLSRRIPLGVPLVGTGCVARRPGTATALQAHSHRRTASARATRPARALHQDGCCTSYYYARLCTCTYTSPNSLSAPMLAPRCRVPAASSSTACTSTSASRSGKTVRL